MRIKAAAQELAAAAQRSTPTAQYLRAFAALCEIATHLLQLDAAELDGDAEAARAQATAVKRRVDLLRSAILRQFTETDPLAAPLLAALEAADGATGAEAQTLLRSWSRLTLPALIVRGPRRFARPAPRTRKRTRSRQSVAVALASLDGQLIAGPQVLRPNTAYALSVEVRPGSWPDWADRLEGEFITHFTPEEAETPIYRWHRSMHPNPQALVGEGTLILRFGLPAGRPAQPFLLALRWCGTREGQPYTQTLDVTGHRELRSRPYDASRDALTKHPSFDERLLKIYESLHSAGYNEDHVQAFCRLFTAICRASLAMTWGGQYKRGVKVSERTFHNDLDSLLRRDPELGGRVERGTRLALGFLDVRHDGITAELKVSPHTAVTRESAPKYIGQPTQYAAADGARLSILCILDMSKKTLPAGTAENYVFTLDPRQHGLDNPEAPSVVAVIIVNGNYPPPSRYSRSRTPLRQPPAP